MHGIGGDTCALSIHVFCYMLSLFGVMVYRSMVKGGGPWYMCILLYVVVLFHTSMVKWRGGTSALSICAFCYMLNLFGVVVFHRCMVNWRRGALVDVHSAICETYLVQCYSILLWLIRGYICPEYMCILLYVKLIWCSGIPQIYGQLEEGGGQN